MQLRGGDGGIVLADQGVEVGHGLLLGHVAVAVFPPALLQALVDDLVVVGVVLEHDVLSQFAVEGRVVLAAQEGVAEGRIVGELRVDG